MAELFLSRFISLRFSARDVRHLGEIGSRLPRRTSKIGADLDNALESRPWLIELRRDARTNHSHGVTPRFIAPRSVAGDLRGRITRDSDTDDSHGGASVARNAKLVRDFFIRSRYLKSRIRKLLSSSETGETDVGGGDSDLAWRQMGKMAARLKTREWSWGVGGLEERSVIF